MTTPNVLAIAYLLSFLVCALGLVAWQRWRRKARLPFGEDLKLLRGPGETQRKLVQQFDEDLMLWVVGAAMVPSTVALAGLWVTLRLPVGYQPAALILTAILFLAAFALVVRWLAGRIRDYRDRYLGYFGERLVAEYLEPLKGEGWRIFHDVPAENNGHRFNIDHVAVGPQGVFAIETKAFRKRRMPSRTEDHKVYFDGQSLVWPWGKDDECLDQAETNAKRLSADLHRELQERIFVNPVVALPGWYVVPKPSRGTRRGEVLNPKQLPNALGSGEAVLSPKNIAMIANKLEARCRDVAY